MPVNDVRRGFARKENPVVRGQFEDQIRHFHFLGICGTAMGAVAAAMRAQGYTVTGSDHEVYPPMSTFLEEQGIALTSGYRAENLPATADLIVVGNAISRGNPELEAVLNRKLSYLSMPETLRHFSSRENTTSWSPARMARRRQPRCWRGSSRMRGSRRHLFMRNMHGDLTRWSACRDREPCGR